jgi:hypothetical protein
MKPPRFVLSLAVLLVAASLIEAPIARAQSPGGGSLAAAFPPVIPLHHRQVWFTYRVNNLPPPCGSGDPTQGFIVAVQLNPSTGANNNCPETICLPSWIDCGPAGDVLSLQAGVTNGNMQVKQLADGWIAYRYDFQVSGAYTQAWDAAQSPAQHKVAVGYSKITGNVYYERNQPVPMDANYSVLGPIAHAFQYTAQIRNFSFQVQAQGSGQSLLFAGQTARWTLSALFKDKNSVAVGQFNLTP